jgi:ADP-ribose pyrophosphatase YjhB (NUDIX family)
VSGRAAAARLALHRLALRVAHPLLLAFRRLARPPVCGVKCVVLQGGSVALVRHTYGSRGRWDLPGGGVKRREQPEEAARREAREEIGVELGPLRHLGAATFDGNPRHVVHAFAGEAASDQLRRDPAEIAEARWFDRRRLPEPTAPWVEAFLGHATSARRG